ncbi:MAG TPA: sugar-binding protein [Gemmatimonadales bacterium]|nr:sugar-binding protein [Gemmatimonadales bacterium]
MTRIPIVPHPLALPLLVAAALAARAASAQPAPRAYVCYRAHGAPRMDGSLDDPVWRAAPWSEAFVDIEGDVRPSPRFATRMKMLWDDAYLYVGAELQEPDVWGTITRRDAVIFHDNDFEMFIDPDGDAKDYAELEINALNTVWDLFLEKPYREGGHADDAWNIEGLRTGVKVLGTLNHPGDADSGWTVTIAIPWRALVRASHTTEAPRPGQRWRINYSRVEWLTDVAGGAYRKVPDLREDNWVWSPQGMVDMHQPEHWGFVEFSATRADRRPPAAPGLPPAVPPRGAPPSARAPAVPVLSGYLADVAGATIAYHSPHPEAETALLARARREVRSVTWLTDTVPASLTADTVTFVWIAGLAGSKGVHAFDFAIGGRHRLTFSSIRDSMVRDWSVADSAGGRLAFRTTLVDQFQDVFGYMTLRLPRSQLTPGRPVELAVTGADAESNDWYMTFRHRLAVHPRVAQDPVLVRDGDTTAAQLRVILDNLANYHRATVTVGDRPAVGATLGFGGNVVHAVAPAVTGAGSVRVVVRLDGVPALDTAVALRSVPRRDVYLLPYSHNDIGYSDLQDRVRAKQWRNIEDALALIDRTRDYPPEARFRWNVEVLWPVESWLAQASPADRARLFAAVREGSIGLNAFEAGVLSGLATAPEMTHFFDYARRLRREDSLPITTALISDIPGQSWGIVTALAQSGIHRFAIAPNNGDRVGYVLQDWGDRPFYWVSQSGRDTVLTWVAGASYSLFHEARIRLFGERRLFSLMQRLETAGYPYVPVQLPYTVDGDNGPTDPDLPDYVREWNRRYASPRLVVATHAQLFDALASTAAGRIPVVAGDLTGYWEDGAASTARETALARAASSRLVQAGALWAMLAPARFPAADDYAAWRDVVLWDEHTWGAAASIETPDAPDVVAQWRYKQAFAFGADSLSRALAAGALATRGASVPGAFDVFNTSSWARTDLVRVPAELSRAGDRVVGPDGRAVPSQRLASGELAVLVSVPPFSARRYFVRAGRAAGRGDARAEGATVRNRLVAAGLDSASGAVAGLMWNARDADLVDPSHRPLLADYRYVAGRDSSAAAGPTDGRWRVAERGPLVAALVTDARAPGARTLRREVRVVSGLGRVDVDVTIDKTAVRTPEGVHVAFPLRVRGGQVRFDVASAVVRPDSDQLPGSARNFVEAQSWVDVSNDSLGATVTTPDAPLVEIGGINAESPWMRAIPPSQTFYAYVMNNYWHTNYRADQEGPVTFRYSIRPHGAFRADAAARAGAEAREPLLVAPAAGRRPAAEPLLRVAPDAVLVTALRPGADGRSWMVSLANPTSAEQRVTLRWRRGIRAALTASDSDERAGAPIAAALVIAPHGTAVVRAERR